MIICPDVNEQNQPWYKIKPKIDNDVLFKYLFSLTDELAMSIKSQIKPDEESINEKSNNKYDVDSQY